MVVTEEMDALRVMGLNPVEFTSGAEISRRFDRRARLTILSSVCGIFAGYVFLAFSIDMSLRFTSAESSKRFCYGTSG